MRPPAETPAVAAAVVLSGSWRADPGGGIRAEELSAAAPLLLRTGAGALGWRRARGTPLHTRPEALQLQRAHRIQMLEAALGEREIPRLFGLLRSGGIEPLLVKGWAVARLYPEKGLRPYGDVDLCVRPAELESARSILAGAGS